MRKGKLIVVDKATLKPGDTCFDAITKRCVEITKIDDAGIFSCDRITGAPQNVIKEVERSADRFVELAIEDEKTEEVFPLDPAQQSYIFKNENRQHLKFFTATSGEKQIAVVLAKDVNMQSYMNRLSPVANMYGQYVAQQKSINEPANNFNDWYFSVSI